MLIAVVFTACTIVLLGLLLLSFLFFLGLNFGLQSKEVEQFSLLFTLFALIVAIIGVGIATKKVKSYLALTVDGHTYCQACNYDLRGSYEAKTCPSVAPLPSPAPGTYPPYDPLRGCVE